jgi:demethylmenaquinone methyltransferase/2-methoxy-6-polyprenyl-1,4-benzoquinol methylase
LAFKDGSFDAVTISFGIRNVVDVDAGLRELYRVIKPGGRVVILEFSMPGNVLVRAGYLVYFRHVLPWIGGIVSGKPAAYRYLNQTVESFPYGQAFCSRMEQAGFEAVKAKPLSFGIATLYTGMRPE